MEIKKEKISWTEKVADKTFVVNTDSDVIVPDTKPDIKKILQVDACAKMTNSEIQNDRILVNGNVYFNIIYIPDDNTEALQSIKTQTPFTDVVSFKGINPQMVGTFEADIAGVNYKIINGRKFSVKSSVEISALIGQFVNTDCVNNIVDDNVQTKSKEIVFLSNSANYAKSFAVNEKIIIPQSEASAAEVIKVTPMINEYTTKIISNKVILKGEVKLSCAYTNSVDAEIKVISGIVPFTEILDVDGIKAEDLTNIKLFVADNSYSCQEDANGEIREIETASEILVKLFALREEKLDVVSDCYATTSKLKTETVVANLPKKICDINYEETFKTQINIAENEPKIGKIYDAFSKAYIEKTEQFNDKLTVSGTIDNYVLYITEQKDLPIYCIKNEIEFSESFDCYDNISADGIFNVKTLNTTYTLSDANCVDLRVNIRIDGVMWSDTKTKIITEVSSESMPILADVASITVYFVQENDSLWDIAKKYFTTVDAIKRINDGISDEVQKGMQLLIPKYKNIS
ncbi:MAG: DUF3794 domain-containing protein [Clostridia bacterium]|nr:DUF3794 domain-containing protein [Clostridia bacterium]